MDDYTLAKRIFNGKGGLNSSDSALSNTVTTFEALALSDSVNGMVTIDMGGAVTSGNGQQGIEVATTVVVKKGQTVIVQNSGGSLVVIGVVGGEDGLKNDIQKDVADQIAEAGDKIQAQVDEELGPLRESFEQFKQDHQFTDEDITIEINKTKTELGTQISGAIETADAAFQSATTAQQTVDSFKTEVNQKFEDYDEGVIELQTSIKQNADNIILEASNREEAVNKALSDAKAYVDVQADSITQVVEKNVTDSIGNTYATKTEVKTTAEGIEKTFEAAVNEVDSKADSAVSTANSASSTANTANSGVNTLKTYIRESTKGIEVGRSSGKYKALVNSSGSFDVLNASGDTIVQLKASGSTDAVLYSPDFSNLAITSNGGSSVSCGSGIIRVGVNSGPIAFTSGGYGYRFHSTTAESLAHLVGTNLIYENSSGNTGTVYLTEDASNFAMITIVFSDSGDRYCSQNIYSPNGKSTALYRAVSGSSYIYLQAQIVTISGSTISRGVNYEADFSNGHTGVTTTNKKFWIHYVIGWRS